MNNTVLYKLLLIVLVIFFFSSCASSGIRSSAAAGVPPLPTEMPPGDDCAERTSILVTEYTSRYTLTSADGKQFPVIAHSYPADSEIQWIPLGEDPVTSEYTAPYSDGFTLAYESPRESCFCQVTWSSDLYVSVAGSGIQTAECLRSGVLLTGNDMDYEICYHLPGSDHRLTYAASGVEESAVCLIRTEEGFRLYTTQGALISVYDLLTDQPLHAAEVPPGYVGVISVAEDITNAALSIELQD